MHSSNSSSQSSTNLLSAVARLLSALLSLLVILPVHAQKESSRKANPLRTTHRIKPATNQRWYGNTKEGVYLSEKDAKAQGYRPTHNGQ